VPGLQRRLLDALAETPKIVLDLSGLKYISSSGVAVFLMVAKRARNRRGGLRLAGVHGAVKETFSILRLDSKGPVLNIFPTVDEALKDF
jgi:anti-sigma B factor antagonist